MNESRAHPAPHPLSQEDILLRLERLLGYAEPEQLHAELQRLVGVLRGQQPVTDVQDHGPTDRGDRAARRTRFALMAQRHTAGALATTLAHEISQPLAAISIYSNAAVHLAGSGELRAGELAEVLGRIESQAKRATEILARVREFTRAGSAEKHSVDLCRTLADTVALMHPLAVNKKVAIHLDLPIQPIRVMAVRAQVAQVVLNLLFNSIEAIDQADSPQRQVRVSLVPEPMGVRVTVHDSGPGLSPADAERIFDSFESDKPDGCGLGLTISRSLIEEQGGKLWVDPQVDHGAALHFWLPGRPDTQVDHCASPPVRAAVPRR
ncbi:HAMP domain-containing sensor histidine kinase [uncultured Lamprocystis sp.]|uniref:sensor histidine kinase n=1 Tax=uncultured Lamprocystis sp. TaxID=543132 RepID=UPI0025EAB09E|nr:HAMP domain-containing sensor histidine kinase [uncultured Lamprocystis sp.]